jgi:hypothetical protein
MTGWAPAEGGDGTGAIRGTVIMRADTAMCPYGRCPGEPPPYRSDCELRLVNETHSLRPSHNEGPIGNPELRHARQMTAGARPIMMSPGHGCAASPAGGGMPSAGGQSWMTSNGRHGGRQPDESVSGILSATVRGAIRAASKPPFTVGWAKALLGCGLPCPRVSLCSRATGPWPPPAFPTSLGNGRASPGVP